MKQLKYTLIVALIGFANIANADVIAQNTTAITENGQTYSSGATDLSAYVNSDVTLDILAAGDFGANDTNELLIFKMNDISIAAWNSSTAPEKNNPLIFYTDENGKTQKELNYWEISGTFNMDSTIVSSEFNTFGDAWRFASSSNSNVTFSWEAVYDNSSGAGVNYLGHGDERVTYTVNAVSAVPEPSTYILMIAGLGLVGFMASRRKKL